MIKCRAIKTYTTRFTRSTQFKAGERVRVFYKSYKNEELATWVKCKNNNGSVGWIPKEYLVRGETCSFLKRDFNATELSIVKNEQLLLVDTIFGYSFIRNISGQTGWVPNHYIKYIDKSNQE